jgi:hypothetical protein
MPTFIIYKNLLPYLQLKITTKLIYDVISAVVTAWCQ